jgi:multidrug efflux pump subunit AcrB
MKLNITGKIAKAFLENPYITILIIIFLFFFGLLSFLITPKEENPQIVIPAANVLIEWPGVSAREVEKRISEVFEDKIMDIPGVQDVYSVSSNSLSMIMVKFFVGEHKENSFAKLYDKLQANRDLLPTGASLPIVKPIDTDDVPIVVFTFTSDIFSIESLKDIAQAVSDKLKTVSGTANIGTIGGYDRRINVFINPLKLESYDLSLTDVINALKQSNLSIPLGDTDIGGKNYLLYLDNQYQDISEIEEQVIAVREERQIILKDIATVSDGLENRESFAFFGTKKDKKVYEQVALFIAKKKGENAVTISDNIIAKFEEIKKGIVPEGVNTYVTRNSGEVAMDAVMSLVNNLWQAVLIVIIVLFLFLGKREALIVAITIPLTISAVFGLGLLFGQTINRITLFALILSLGMLVDSSIVVVENISRHLKMNDRPRTQAVYEAVSEVGFGLIASTLTTIFAFYPMAFVTGMMGPYMGPIPFNTPNALIAALFLSFAITPFLAIKILKFENRTTLIEEKNKYKEYFKEILLRILKSQYLRKLVLFVSSLMLIFVMVFPVLPIITNYFHAPKFLNYLPTLEFKMLPKADKNTLSLFIDFPYGTGVSETKERATFFSEYLFQNEYIDNFSMFIGQSSVVDFNSLLRGSGQRISTNQITISINLEDKDNRAITSKEIVWMIREDLKDIAYNTQAKYKIIEDPPGPPVRSTILGRIFVDEDEVIEQASLELKGILDSTAGIKDTDTTINDPQLKYVVNLDRRKADLLGVSNEELANNLKLAVDGFSPTILHQYKDEDEVKIWVQVDPEEKKSLDYLNHLSTKTYNGEYVPFSEIATIRHQEKENPIYHENQEKLTYVYGETEIRSQIYAVLEVMKKIRANELLKDLKITWGGEWELTMDVFRDLGLAMLVGIFIIYFILVAQFKSFHIPLLVLGTVPLAMIGIIPGFILIGLQFNATSMIGTIALSGIVVNNAIIMLEYIENLRAKGLMVIEAVSQAVLTRMKPILLTSLTTIFGSLTIALGDEVWAGLGWAIIWGMLISTGLTLIVFPVLYVTSEIEKEEKENSFTSLV